MEQLDKVYKGGFFQRRYRESWRVPYIVKALIETFKPSLVVDVGCGIGDVVDGLWEAGVSAYGIEGTENCLPYLVTSRDKIYIHDMRRSLDVPLDFGGLLVGPFDLAISIEVAEHIDPEYADCFLNNLTKLSDRILMTGAPPGQKGHSHLNCQKQSYWIQKMRLRNYRNKWFRGNEFSAHFAPMMHKRGIKQIFETNLMYFERL